MKKTFLLFILAILIAAPAANAIDFGNGFDQFGDGFDQFGDGFNPFGDGFDPFGDGFDPFNDGFDPFNDGFDQFDDGSNQNPDDNTNDNSDNIDVTEPEPTPQPQPTPQPEPVPTPNQAPYFTTEAPTEVQVGQTYNYNADAVDPDNGPQQLQFSLASAPSGMTVDATTGMVAWEPGILQVGDNEVTLRVSDGAAAVEQSFTVAVRFTQVDQPAVWNDLPDITIRQGSPDNTIIQQNVYAQCSDADSETLTFAVESSHANYDLGFSSNNLVIINLNSRYVGAETVTLSCNGVQESFALTVLPFNYDSKTVEEEDDEVISVHVGRIGYMDQHSAGGQMAISISFENNGDESLEHASVKVAIPELGIRSPRMGPFELSTNKKVSKTLVVDLPKDVRPGWYMMRFNIDDNGLHRVIHRDFEIVEE